MARINGLYFVLVSIGLLMLVDIGSTEDTPSATLVSCQNAKAATVNATMLKGEWYEVARKPIDSSSVKEECVKMNFNYNASAILAEVTFNNDTNKLNSNHTMNYTINYTVEPKLVEAVYNYTFNGTITTYKIVETDHENYAFVCAFIAEMKEDPNTPANSSHVHVNSTGAFILTRQRELNSTFMSSLSTLATHNFTDFNNLQTVIQSPKCYNSAGSLVPAFGLILAFLMSVFLRQ